MGRGDGRLSVNARKRLCNLARLRLTGRAIAGPKGGHMNPAVEQARRRFRALERNVLKLCVPAFLVVAVVTVWSSVPAGARTVRVHKPGAPTAVTATALSGGAEVSWTAPTSDGGSPVTGYTVTASRGDQTCTTTGVTTCTVTGLTNGRSYALRVRASNVAGSGRAATVWVSLLPSVSFASTVSFPYPAEQAVVTLSEATSRTVRVGYTTSDAAGVQLFWAAWAGDAASFHPSSGTVKFAPGQTSATIPFTVDPTTARACSVQSMELGLPCYPAVLVTLVNPAHALLGPTPASSLYYAP